MATGEHIFVGTPCIDETSGRKKGKRWIFEKTGGVGKGVSIRIKETVKERSGVQRKR